MIKFSIIITCHNREKFISKSIRSALNQVGISRNEFEILVVDDNSQDDSVKLIKDFLPTIKFLKNQKNLGISSARNLGIKNSKGIYIFMLDSDDYISNNLLQVMGLFLDNNEEWDAAACDYTKVYENGKIIKRFFFKKNPIACGVLYRRKCIFDLGLYNKKLKIHEEKDLRERFLKKKYKMGYVQLPLYRYVIHSNNITGKIK
jgi:glycosyltransferase involved in cell wall biosynthesis